MVATKLQRAQQAVQAGEGAELDGMLAVHRRAVLDSGRGPHESRGLCVVLCALGWAAGDRCAGAALWGSCEVWECMPNNFWNIHG